MNKFLISVLVPTIEMEFNVYIPNNRKLGTIKRYILNSIYELSGYSYLKNPAEIKFTDKESGREYADNMYVKDSGIKNGSKIVIL